MMSSASMNDNDRPQVDTTTEEAEPLTREQRREQRRAERKRPKKLRQITTLVFNPIFVILFGLLMLACGISFFLVLNHPDENNLVNSAAAKDGNSNGTPIVNRISDDRNEQKQPVQLQASNGVKNQKQKPPAHQVQEQLLQGGQALLHSSHKGDVVPHYNPKPIDKSIANPHLVPPAPPLPIFPKIPNAQQLIDDVLHHNKPTIAGIIAFLYQYLEKLHQLHKRSSQNNQTPEMDIITNYFKHTHEFLSPLDEAYRGRSIFPIREEEDSIFVSLAAFREHLLAPTLQSAFDQAEHPEKLYIGAVVQNCFGLNGTICRTGVQVIGKNKEGKDMTKVSDAPPDENGIETFCNNPKYKPYCDDGHVRAIYIHDTDALGPQTARYYASKLWGGETFYMQMDSHLEFAKHWDTKYKQEVRLAKNYPKAILSAYPPGFSEFNLEFKGGSPGGRLCTCEFSGNDVENHIIRINQAGRTPNDAERPTQIAFIAAGFFFAHASFLIDVPFDPYAPWCFMGEEIALSIRAWTHGWNIYAPRKSLIAHQYRPGRLGLPKFWESVGRDAGRPQLNTRLQKHVIRRIKHMVGYTTDTSELIKQDGDEIVLTDYQHYSLGDVRPLQDYLTLTNIDVVNQKCKRMDWCEAATLE